MAAAVTLLGSATWNTSNGTKTVTATPAVGDLIVIITAHSGNTSGAAPTDNNSDGNGTYSPQGSCWKNASADIMQFWARDALIGSASSTVFTHAPGTSTGGGLACLKVTGMSRVGSQCGRQNVNQVNQSAGGTPTGTFGSGALTTNPLIGAVFNASNPANLTPRASWTERVDLGYNNPTSGIEVMTIDSGETASSIAWGGTSATAFCSLVLELDASYILGLAPGSYSLTGTATALFRGVSDAVTPGSYSITGQSVALTRAKGIAITPGSYSVSGQSTGLLWKHSGSLAAGSYSLTGSAVTLRRNVTIITPPGAYTISGQAVGLLWNHRITITPGSYSVTGTATALKWGHKVAITPGSYSVSGQTVALKWGHRISIAVGSYSITGQATGLLRGRVLNPASGSYGLSGTSSALLWARSVGLAPGAYVLAGQSVSLFRPVATTLVIASGSYTLTGQSVALLRGHLWFIRHRAPAAVAKANQASPSVAALTLTAAPPAVGIMRSA